MIAAETSWSEAAIAIAGIALVGSVIVIAVWQLLATWRARMAGSRESAYRKLAEEATEAQRRIADELSELRARTQELERMLKEVG
jgi:type VI protein secretion system component VasK